MWIDVLKFLGIYLSTLALVFICGNIVLKLLRKTLTAPGLYTGLFLSLLFGLISLVTIFALVKTHFLTVCIFFPLLFFLCFFKRDIRLQALYPAQEITRGFSFYSALILFTLLPFIYFSLIVFKSGDFHFSALDYDNVLYSKLSAFIAQSGIENRWGMVFSDLSLVKGVEPYHYVDSWLNAACFSISGLPPLLLFYLVTYPVLIMITLCGILAIIERFKKISIYDFLVVILLISIGPIYQVKMANYHFNSMACEIPLQHFGEKYSVFYPFIMLSVLFVLNNYFREALIWLLSLAIVSSTTLPALSIFLIPCAFFLKENKIQLMLKLTIFFTAYLSFYILLSSGEESNSNAENIIGFTDFGAANFDWGWLKLTVSNFMYSLCSNLKYFLANYVYAVPILVYFIFFRKSKQSKLLLFLLCLCFSGLIAASFLYKLPDSHQLFTNTLPLFHCIMIMLIITLFYSFANKLTRIFILIVTGLFFTNTIACSLVEYSDLHAKSGVSDAYLLEVKKLTMNDPGDQRIGYISNQQDEEYLKFNPDSNYLYHLSYLDINPIPLRMSLPEINDSGYTHLIKKSDTLKNNHELFYTFYLKLSARAQNPDTIKYRFIKKYHLTYLLIGPTTPIPSFISTINPAIIRDQKTGIRFLRLRSF